MEEQKSIIEMEAASPNPSAFADAFAKIEGLNRHVRYIELSSAIAEEILKTWTEDQYDQEQAPFRKFEGWFGTVWGATMMVNKDLPENIAMVISDLNPPWNAVRITMASKII